MGRFALPHASLYLVAGQAGVLLCIVTGSLHPEWLVFAPGLVEQGQWWRLFTFILLPPPFSPTLLGYLFLIFGWWLFYFMGSALEHDWGAFRFNAYLLFGYALTVGLSFLTPGALVTNLFLAGSVFLAFAYLNPTFELVIFFILPVQIRWLALITWACYAYSFVTGNGAARLQIAAATGNFFLFFGRDLWRRAGLRTRQMRREAAAPKAGQPRHRCRVCGKTDLSNPELDFRYCSKCAGEECYCPEHIFNHTHVTAESQTAGS